MIRRPSTYARLYAWWRDALAGRDVVHHEGWPECGYYKRKMVKGGPWVPARIFVEREIDADTGELACDERFRIEISGMDAGEPADHWSFLTPISRDEFDRLMDAPLRDSRMADPMRRVDLTHSPTFPNGAI